MAVPTINTPPGGALHFRVGSSVSIGLSASDSPTSWAVTSGVLPPGLSLGNDGIVSGTPSAAAYRSVGVTATNGTGDSTEVTFPIGVVDCGSKGNAITDPAILIDHALDSKLVTAPAGYTPPAGIETPEPSEVVKALGPPVLEMSKGDNRLLSYGLLNAGAAIAADVKTIKLGIKEFEGETLYSLSDGTFTASGAGASTRYQFETTLDASTFARLLSSYEEDSGTFFDAIAEIELRLNRVQSEAKQTVVSVANATDTITLTAHAYSNGDLIRMHGDDLPAGLSEGVDYWVVSKTTDTFKLSATTGGSAIDLTDDGSGTIQAQRYAAGEYIHTSRPFAVRIWRDLIV